MEVEGSSRAWSAVRLKEASGAGVSILHESPSGLLRVRAQDPPSRVARWLAVDTVHLLLGQLGGTVETPKPGPPQNLDLFYKNFMRPALRERHLMQLGFWNWFWLVFPWVVFLGSLLLLIGGDEKIELPAWILTLLSLASALFLTWDFFQPKEI